jgi:hypothetical protein
MDFEQAEHLYQELQNQRDRGDLDADTFRVEVAKLLVRDDHGIFWMLDAADGRWYCNQGDGWILDDPRAAQPLEPFLPPKRKPRARLRSWALGIGIVVIVLAGLAGILTLQQWPDILGNPTQRAAEDQVVKVTIASPADGSQVAIDQEIAIESTIDTVSGLEIVDHVDLVVNGQTVGSVAVRPKIQPGQTSLPLSQAWLPTTTGEYQVTVIARWSELERLGEASITLYATEAPDEKRPEPACTPDATFVKDVTIPPGTAFPPGARMDKVWQVRNSGSCAWGVGYELALVEGDALGAPSAVPVPSTASNQTVDLTITFWAPQEVGSYTSTWQLQSPNGEFFGPTLALDIKLEILAQEDLPPPAPSDLQATVSEDGKAVRLSWTDHSDNEDAFRIYREDVEASIGLVPANSVRFVDHNVACGNVYRYAVVAFNAAGTSPLDVATEVTLPPCSPTNEPPSLILTVIPTQVLASEVFTVTFQAGDDMGMDTVVIWGEETGEPKLDLGRVFTCAETICAGDWPITSTGKSLGRITVIGLAKDSSGLQSNPARTSVIILGEQ